MDQKPINLTGFNDLQCFLGMLVRSKESFYVSWTEDEDRTKRLCRVRVCGTTFCFQANGHLQGVS